jgi:hypothetical protein
MSDDDESKNANSDSEIPTPQPRITRKIADIPNVLYGVPDGQKSISMEPSADDINEAINGGQLEARGFQADLDALRSEWEQRSNGNSAEFYRLQKIYHARRIAYFAVNGWSDPVDLTADGKIRDGLHRFKAAIFLGLDEVGVKIEEPAAI